MKNIRILILSSIVAMALPALALAATSVNEGYLVDSAGNIVRNGFGECWHAGYWTAEMAVAECDSAAVKQGVAPPVRTGAASPSPPPPPVLAAIPLKKVSIVGAAHFDFDESVLRAEDKTRLEAMVQELAGATYNSILVVGHADRLGSDEYNMRLSLRRANEVAGYLASKGIPADRIKIEGRGEMEQVSKSSDCMGLTRARTIICLQPDRRTEITVMGNEAANKK